jgi:RNA polymerase sigma factor (TIGR02999 family)
MSEITELLGRAHRGDTAAVNELMPLVYARLRELAHRQLGAESQPRTLDTTALVHELYLDLVEGNARLPDSARGQFFAYAATAMRHILVDAARRRTAAKRGGAARRVDLDAGLACVDAEAHEVLAIDEALSRLQQADPRLARVIEMRFFAGLSVEDTAASLQRDPRSVVRDWRKARLFLHEALAVG